MARLLVQLKLRLVLNALRASTGAKVAFMLSTVCAALVAGGVFYLLSILGRRHRGGGPDHGDLHARSGSRG